jgi:predicted RNA-binding Zn ribbon-like protein
MVRTNMTETETHAGNLKLIGGWLCLDFVNTVDWRNSDHPHEWLTKYSDLVSWSRHTGILTDNEARNLLRKGELGPADAKTVVEQAIILREALYRIFSAIANHHLPSPSDITTLNTELSKAMAQLRLVPMADSYSWIYAFKDNALDRMLWSIVRSAADLLTSNKLNRISQCSAEDCGWLFLDISRNRSRRWCDMKDCGNRAKARRHYQRERSLRKKAT